MSDVRAARGPYRGTAEKRAEILRVAADEFARAGYGSASLRRIAARVGISHPGLLHHYASKEELLVAVLVEQERRDRAALDLLAAPDTVESLIRMLVASTTIHQDDPGAARLWASLTVTATAPGHPAHAFVARRYAAWTEELAGRLEAMKASGELRGDLGTTSAARAVLAVLMGAQLHLLADPAVDVEAVFRSVLDGFRP